MFFVFKENLSRLSVCVEKTMMFLYKNKRFCYDDDELYENIIFVVFLVDLGSTVPQHRLTSGLTQIHLQFNFRFILVYLQKNSNFILQ